MKKLILCLSLAGASLNFNAQTPWTTDLNSGSGFKLGLNTPDDLNFYTNGQPVMSLSSHGDLLVNSLADPTATDNRILYIDASGNLRTSPFPPLGIHKPCVANTLPWYEGGNFGSTYNDIGTCDDKDFILKANNAKSVFIKSTSGLVGIGLNNSSPQAVLDVSDGASGSTLYHTLITGDVYGRIQTVGTEMSMVSASDFFVHTGGLFTPGSSERFAVRTNGYVGVGTYTPSSKFEVRDGGQVEAKIYATSANASKLWVMNSIFSYNLSIDNSGIGHIGANVGIPNQYNLINFRTDNNHEPLVWIGEASGAPDVAELSINSNNNANALDIYNSAATSPANKVVFRVKNTGVVYAQEINVQTANYPDYVFKDDYKLMPLETVEAYIQKNHHLPNVPDASDVEKNGLSLGQINKIQMEKIEELTLYVIELKKEIEALKNK